MHRMATTISDKDLVRQLQDKRQREKAFRLLVHQYQERLYWHIRRMVIEHEDANDVVQNTFIKVYRSIDSFKGKSKLYTWLYRIATNETLTFLGKKKRKATEALDHPAYNMAEKLQADSYMDSDSIQQKLQQAIHQLPEKQRLVFNMRYYDEMSYRDIAAVLNKSVGGLKASYHHAVKKIERYLKAQV